MKNIMAIDPGCFKSAYCICDYETLKPLKFDKIDNEELLSILLSMISDNNVEAIGIEHMQSYNKGVGKEVFETCYYIGRLTDRIVYSGVLSKSYAIYRSEEKIGVCGNVKANDSIIMHTLIDKFAKFDLKKGKGTKHNPDWFYGFSADMWQAYAQCYVLKLKIEGKI